MLSVAGIAGLMLGGTFLYTKRRDERRDSIDIDHGAMDSSLLRRASEVELRDASDPNLRVESLNSNSSEEAEEVKTLSDLRAMCDEIPDGTMVMWTFGYDSAKSKLNQIKREFNKSKVGTVLQLKDTLVLEHLKIHENEDLAREGQPGRERECRVATICPRDDTETKVALKYYKVGEEDSPERFAKQLQSDVTVKTLLELYERNRDQQLPKIKIVNTQLMCDARDPANRTLYFIEECVTEQDIPADMKLKWLKFGHNKEFMYPPQLNRPPETPFATFKSAKVLSTHIAPFVDYCFSQNFGVSDIQGWVIVRPSKSRIDSYKLTDPALMCYKRPSSLDLDIKHEEELRDHGGFMRTMEAVVRNELDFGGESKHMSENPD